MDRLRRVQETDQPPGADGRTVFFGVGRASTVIGADGLVPVLAVPTQGNERPPARGEGLVVW